MALGDLTQANTFATESKSIIYFAISSYKKKSVTFKYCKIVNGKYYLEREQRQLKLKD
jgi:predicted nucleic-acid-binding protein